MTAPPRIFYFCFLYCFVDHARREQGSRSRMPVNVRGAAKCLRAGCDGKLPRGSGEWHHRKCEQRTVLRKGYAKTCNLGIIFLESLEFVFFFFLSFQIWNLPTKLAKCFDDNFCFVFDQNGGPGGPGGGLGVHGVLFSHIPLSWIWSRPAMRVTCTRWSDIR